MHPSICDDDMAMTTTIEEMLYETSKEQNVKINCAVFFDGSTLVENIRQGTCYDLIYLDIEMHKVNGISAIVAYSYVNHLYLSPRFWSLHFLHNYQVHTDSSVEPVKWLTPENRIQTWTPAKVFWVVEFLEVKIFSSASPRFWSLHFLHNYQVHTDSSVEPVH